MIEKLLSALGEAYNLLVQELNSLKDGIDEKQINDCSVLCTSYNLCKSTNLVGTRIVHKHRDLTAALLEKIQHEIHYERRSLLEKQEQFEAICNKISEERKKLDELLQITIGKCEIELLLCRTENRMSAIEMVEIFQDFEKRLVNEYNCRDFLLQKTMENISDNSFDQTWKRKNLTFIDDILLVGSQFAKNS